MSNLTPLQPTISQFNEVKTKVDAAGAPTTVADAAERKALTGGVVGATRIIQSDLIGILWTLVAADATLDASWIGQPYTTDPDGDVVINMQLADVVGTVPDPNVLGQVYNIPTLGNGETIGGNRVAMNYELRKAPPGYIRYVSTETSGGNSPIFGHDGADGATGICYSVDGSTPVYVALPAGSNSSIAVPTNDGAPVEVYLWAATSATSGRVGNLSIVYIQNNEVASLDVSSLPGLTDLVVTNGSVESLDFSATSVLNLLNASNNALTSVIMGGGDLAYEVYGSFGSSIADNNLSLPALIAFAESLGTTSTGIISYGNNPGSDDFETWLATGDDKGYVWINGT